MKISDIIKGGGGGGDNIIMTQKIINKMQQGVLLRQAGPVPAIHSREYRED